MTTHVIFLSPKTYHALYIQTEAHDYLRATSLISLKIELHAIKVSIIFTSYGKTRRVALRNTLCF